tara:strand:- start:3644 stop:4798 length:1155 start_codon:yes stop_codon:yes gene_type:complete
MEPSVLDLTDQEGTSYFTISNINVSQANAIRRTILADIPTVVIRTFPYEQNDVVFEVNTSRLNNEILKQRLSCIPIFIKDIDMDLSDYLLEVDVKNTTDQLIYVTTRDFKIKSITTGKYLNDETLTSIFPPNNISNQYIDFCRLRPQLSDNLEGEHVKFTAKFSIGTASENGAFNVVSTCSYGSTPDTFKISEEREKKITELRAKNIDEEDILYQISDWENLDAKRITIADSFNFRLKTLGVFTNSEIIIKALKVIIQKLKNIITIYSNPNSLINDSNTTIANSFDITLENEDFTIGKILEFGLYQLYYIQDKTLSFCGFNKPHPHLPNSTIRIAFKESTDKNTATSYLINSANINITLFEKLLPQFGETLPSEAAALQNIPTI